MIVQELTDTIVRDTLVALPRGPGLKPFDGWVIFLVAMLLMMLALWWAGLNLTKWARE